MRNTTKLKYILQIFNLTLEMDEEELLHLGITNKRTGESSFFVDKSYSVVISKAFAQLNKELKQ